MWIVFALLSAVFAASRRTTEKNLTRRLNHFSMGFATQLLGLPVITAALALHGKILNPLHLGIRFWLPLVVISLVFYPLNTYLALQAIKHGELSKVLPIQSLWPVFSLVPAWFTLHEVPKPLAVAGILLTVAGVYAIGLKGRALHHPLQPFREERSSRLMLLGVILVTFAGVLDKIAIQASDAIYFSFASTVGSVLGLAAILFLHKINELPQLKASIKNIGTVGTLQGVSYTTYLIAIGLGPIAYVSSIRSSNVLIGAFLGILLLKEDFTAAKKLSFALIAAGGVTLALGS